MKRTAAFTAALVVMAACGDDPTAPFAPQFDHTGQDPAHAIHDLSTPTDVDASQTDAASIRVTWSPTIAALQTECDALAAANTEHPDQTCRMVRFEVYRNGEKVADVEVSSYDDEDLEPGTYSYTVKAFGQEHSPGSAIAAFTYHSQLSDATAPITIGSTCGVPTVSAEDVTPDQYTRINVTVAVTFSGSTTNLIGCAGAEAEYRIVAYNTNNDNVIEEHTTDWDDLMPSFGAGSEAEDYSIDLELRRHNQNVRFEFEVRVRHTAEPTWVELTDPKPDVTIVPGGSTGSTSRGR